MSAVERPVLTLRTCRLYADDVRLFYPAQWLNDACISFCFEVLQAEANMYYAARARFPDKNTAQRIAHALVYESGSHDAEYDELLRYKLGLGDGSRKPHSVSTVQQRSTSPVSFGSEGTHEDEEAQECSPILFVDPCVSFWVSMCPDETEVKESLDGLRLPLRSVVVWPITDQQDPSVAGGAHWTLLIEVACSGGRAVHATNQQLRKAPCQATNVESGHQFFHFDSLGPDSQGSRGNLDAARRLQQVLECHMTPFKGGNACMVRSQNRTGAAPTPLCCTPRQSNTFDCGVHCLVFAERLLRLMVRIDCEHLNKESTSVKAPVSLQAMHVVVKSECVSPGMSFDTSWFSLPELHCIEPSAVAAKRRDALDLVHRLTRE